MQEPENDGFTARCMPTYSALNTTGSSTAGVYPSRGVDYGEGCGGPDCRPRIYIGGVKVCFDPLKLLLDNSEVSHEG